MAELYGSTPTGRTRHTVGGHIVEEVAGLVIAQYDSDTGVYLFYCDEQWTCITDTWHGDVAGAVDQAEYEFGSVEFVEVSATETTTS